MMSYEGYQDRILTCRDCGQEFTFTSGEQEFFATKGLTNAPSRCPECRKARRNGPSSNQRPRGGSGEREQYDAICATCGKPTTVPFIPREDRPVYCSDCFQEQRASRPSYGGGYNSGGGGYSSGNSGGSGYGGGGYGSGNSGGGRGSDRRDRNGGRGGGDRRDRNNNWDRW